MMAGSRRPTKYLSGGALSDSLDTSSPSGLPLHTRSKDMVRKLSRFTRPAAACAAMAIGVAACASTPIPNEGIAVAKASVQRAEQSGAPELAPVEMAAARDKLARAEKAAAAHEAAPATELAD